MLTANNRQIRLTLLLVTLFTFVVFLITSSLFGTTETAFQSKNLSKVTPKPELSESSRLSTRTTDDYQPENILLNRKTLLDNHRLHDTTLQMQMDPYIRREWLEFERNSSVPKPPAMLLLPNIGWNQPNQVEGIKWCRFLRVTRLMKGVINHPWFHPTAWEDIVQRNATIHPDVRYYVFPDKSTCFESHWPTYAGYEKNLDTFHNRTNNYWAGSYDTFDLFQHPIFQKHNSNNSIVIEFNCGPFGAPQWFLDKRKDHNVSLALALISANVRDTIPIDQGIPPPCVTELRLTKQQVRDIATCTAESETRRPFLLTYLGNFRSHGPPAFSARQKLTQFNDNNKTFIIRQGFYNYDNPIIGNMSFAEILSKSLFSAAPRGDNKFSYRFCEVLSAGAIPVVFADDWLWPFRPELVDWGECAVVLPENSPHETINVINNITIEERCRRRQRCYEIYKQYVEEDQGTVDGLIKGLELVALGHQARPFGVHCLPGDDPNTTCNFER